MKIAQAEELMKKGYWYANKYFDLLESLKDKGSTWAEEKKEAIFAVQGFFFGYHENPNFLPQSYFESYTSFNEQLLNKDAVKPCKFFLKKGTTLSNAVETFSDHLSFIDCAIIFPIVQCKFLLKNWEKEEFNRYFANIKDLSTIPIMTEFQSLPADAVLERNESYVYSENQECIISSQFEKSDKKFNYKELSKGDRTYFYNHPIYSHKEVNGECRGFNVLYAGKSKNGTLTFLGFGLNHLGVNEDEINESLVKEFNSDKLYNERVVTRNFWEELGKDREQYEFFSKTKIDKKLLIKSGGGISGASPVLRFNWNLLKCGKATQFTLTNF